VFDFLSPVWIQDLIQTYGLWILFGVVMLESMGLPLPGETALVTSALYSCATHRIDITAVVGVAALAAIVGDNLGYLIGRSIGLRLITRYGGFVGLDERRLKLGQYLFRRHGGKIVFFGRFVAFLRALAAVLAGANLMPWRHFLVMNALGGILWASLFGFGACLLGEEMKRVAGPVGLLLLVAALGIMVAGVLFFRRHEKELEERAEADSVQSPGRPF
jgi:membrane protein DedA with SNARE-associated domain